MTFPNQEQNLQNPAARKWWNEQMYGTLSSEPCYPEEDYQVEALPKEVLHKEVGRRLGVVDSKIIWRGKEICMSAVSEEQLLHHISLHL